MSIVIKTTDIKFYDKETGEEIPPYIPAKEDEKVELERERLKKLTGYSFPELCPNCGKYYEGYDGHYEIDGDFRCENCMKYDDKLKLPFFAPEIPSYVEGATRRFFTFKDSSDLYNKMKSRLHDGEILVKSNNMIMSQSINRVYWWVEGYINNYDIGLLDIPTFNSNIYNGDGDVVEEKLNKWIEDKTIIKGIKNEN